MCSGIPDWCLALCAVLAAAVMFSILNASTPYILYLALCVVLTAAVMLLIHPLPDMCCTLHCVSLVPRLLMLYQTTPLKREPGDS